MKKRTVAVVMAAAMTIGMMVTGVSVQAGVEDKTLIVGFDAEYPPFRDIFLRCQFPYGIGFGPGICGAVEGDASGKWEGKGLCKRREQDAFYSQIVSGSIG